MDGKEISMTDAASLAELGGKYASRLQLESADRAKKVESGQIDSFGNASSTEDAQAIGLLVKASEEKAPFKAEGKGAWVGLASGTGEEGLESSTKRNTELPGSRQGFNVHFAHGRPEPQSARG